MVNSLLVFSREKLARAFVRMRSCIPYVRLGINHDSIGGVIGSHSTDTMRRDEWLIGSQFQSDKNKAVNMLQNYLPVLIFLGISTVIGIVLLTLGFLLGSGGKDAEKLSPYECGFEAFEDSRGRFDVRYYLVAILFIIFDLEIAFLFPWAISLDAVGGFGLVSMGIFLAILVVGFIYEWKKGALEWD